MKKRAKLLPGPSPASTIRSLVTESGKRPRRFDPRRTSPLALAGLRNVKRIPFRHDTTCHFVKPSHGSGLGSANSRSNAVDEKPFSATSSTEIVLL